MNGTHPKKATPPKKASTVNGGNHVPKPLSFYAEEHDKKVPELQQVEKEIEEEIQQLDKQEARALTLVRSQSA